MSGEFLLRFETDLGDIDVVVHADRAPVTAAYVRGLAEAGRFDDTSFYRSTTFSRPERGPLIQGGPLAPVVLTEGARMPNVPMLDTVEATDHTGLAHRPGAVSLARDLMATGRVLPEVFICLGDYPELDAAGRSEPDDRGFPVFGTVVAGLDVAAAIGALDTGGVSHVERLVGEVLTHPVRIRRATVSALHPDPHTDTQDVT